MFWVLSSIDATVDERLDSKGIKPFFLPEYKSK